MLDPHDDHVFGQVDLAYYPTDDLKVYGGYRYVNEASLGGAGIEYLLRDYGSPISLFAKADFGETQYNRITGGLRFYLGPNPDKSLIARHRTEDPENYTPMFPRLSEIATGTPQCTVNGAMYRHQPGQRSVHLPGRHVPAWQPTVTGSAAALLVSIPTSASGALPPVAAREPPLQEGGIARHAKAEHPEDQPGKEIAGRRRLRRVPLDVG